MMFLLMVVKSDEDVNGYGNGNKGDSARRAHIHPLPPPYYFILTVHNLAPNAYYP